MKLRIVLVEDEPGDAELLERELRKSGTPFSLVRVASRAELLRALESGRPDVIISDHHLPQFSGRHALTIVQQLETPPPFILVTGSLDEETAVDYMKAGAADYILKDRLTRVGPAVAAAVQRDRDRLAKQRAEAERKRLEEQLLHSQKMEAVGRLAGGVAHDFNNVLTGILISADLLLSDMSADDPRREEVAEIRLAAGHAARLTRQLLAFSRKQLMSFKVIDLNETVRSVTNMLQRLIGEDISLRMELANELWPVRADVGQLEQVLLNLVVNARDAMPQGGEVVMRTRNVEIDAARAELPVPGGPWVQLRVSDTGVGMDEATRARIFEPFFTTKESGKGTGLGLSTVYGIVHQHGGHIRVRSEPGRGTVIEIDLPRADGEVARSRATEEAMSYEGTESLLLVEDEPLVREVTRRALERFGYRVQAAGNFEEALAALQTQHARFDLLITDVVMPKVGGPEVAARLARAGLHVPVLFLSGYSEEAVEQQGRFPPGSSFLSKPYAPRELARKIREMLGSPTSPQPPN
jgi:signal transduction histidine kinase